MSAKYINVHSISRYNCKHDSKMSWENKSTARTLLLLFHILSHFTLLGAKTDCDTISNVHQQRMYGKEFNISLSVCYNQSLYVDRVRQLLHCADICTRNKKCNFYNYKDFGRGVLGLCLLFRGALQDMDSNCFTKATDGYEHWQAIIDRGFLARV